MHLLVFHLPDILDHVGHSFHNFNQQVVELAMMMMMMMMMNWGFRAPQQLWLYRAHKK